MDDKKRNMVVDGTDSVSGLFMGDGELPPFVVFDVDAQENIAGPFHTRAAADSHRLEILAGVEPWLDGPALAAWIEKIDEERDC
jgi:hypothetical protein